MKEEKQLNGTKWYVHNDLRFRMKEIENLKIIVWVTDAFIDVSFALIMNDFIDRCEENNLYISVDKSWNAHRGFIVDKEDLNFLMGEIIGVVSEYEIEMDESEDKISENEWYME